MTPSTPPRPPFWPGLALGGARTAGATSRSRLRDPGRDLRPEVVRKVEKSHFLLFDGGSDGMVGFLGPLTFIKRTPLRHLVSERALSLLPRALPPSLRRARAEAVGSPGAATRRRPSCPPSPCARSRFPAPAGGSSRRRRRRRLRPEVAPSPKSRAKSPRKII